MERGHYSITSENFPFHIFALLLLLSFPFPPLRLLQNYFSLWNWFILSCSPPLSWQLSHFALVCLLHLRNGGSCWYSWCQIFALATMLYWMSVLLSRRARLYKHMQLLYPLSPTLSFNLWQLSQVLGSLSLPWYLESWIGQGRGWVGWSTIAPLKKAKDYSFKLR